MTLAVVLSGVATAIATFSTIYGMIRSHKSDNSKDGREMGQIMTELGYIKSSLDSISTKVDRQDERHATLIENIGKITSRVSLLESYQNTNNTTFDNLNRKIEQLDNQIDLINSSIADIKTEIAKLEK